MDLHGRVAQRKPLLSAPNRRKRFLWAKKRADWTIGEWEQCFFSDETAVQLMPNNRRYIRCPASQLLKPQNVQPRVQAGGGKIMVWGGFSGVGVTALARVEGNINTSCYLNVLQEHLLPLHLAQHGLTFQQDNAPAHKSRKTLQWLQDHDISVLDWPPQSPDLNPIENIWGEIKQRLQDFQIHGKDDLWLAVQQIWMEFSTDYFTRFAHTMPSRIKAVIAARGCNTRF
jgi:transposase